MGTNADIRCPKCGSDEVSKPRVQSSWVVMAILAIGYPFPIPFKKCLCYDCGHIFIPSKERIVSIDASRKIPPTEA